MHPDHQSNLNSIDQTSVESVLFDLILRNPKCLGSDLARDLLLNYEKDQYRYQLLYEEELVFPVEIAFKVPQDVDIQHDDETIPHELDAKFRLHI